MDILVIGATGGSGRATTDALLARGHRVTALARRASTLPAREGLVAVDGDATDRGVLERLMPGHDAVIVTLGISEPPLRVRLRGARSTPGDVRSRATELLVDVARRAGVRRIVVQSSYGVGSTRDRLRLRDRVIFAAFIKPQIFDSELQEAVVRGSGLDWTIVQPVYLTDDDSAVHHTTLDGGTRTFRVSRRGVAAVHVDLVEADDRVGEVVTVSG